MTDPYRTVDEQIHEANKVIAEHMMHVLEKTHPLHDLRLRTAAWAVLGAIVHMIPSPQPIWQDAITILGEIADSTEECQCGECGGAKVPPAAALLLEHMQVYDWTERIRDEEGGAL